MSDIRIHTRIPSQTADADKPAGDLRRALYLWERQPPSPASSPEFRSEAYATTRERSAEESENNPEEQPLSDRDPVSPEQVADEWLQDHVRRLSALDHVIPGDRRLDGPRFSLMMLNAFLGRAATDGVMLARLPGLMSIRERIETELSQLEHEYPERPDPSQLETETAPVQIREEIRSFFAEFQTTQKAQQRQIVSSLTILHSAISELRARLPDPDSPAPAPETAMPPESVQMPPIDDLARPLIDAERLLDPRPVLAAARAAASRSLADSSQAETLNMGQAARGKDERPYRSVLLGSAVLGFLMIFFGRDAVQFLTSASLQNGSVTPP